MKLKTLYNPDSIVKIVPIYPKRISKEAFIILPENKKKNGNNKMLIDYLKGKRKTLKFKN